MIEFRRQFHGVAHGLQGLVPISVIAKDVGQPQEVVSRSLIADSDRIPCCQCFVAMMQRMAEIAQIDSVLRLIWIQSDGLLIQTQRSIGKLGVSHQITDVTDGDGIVVLVFDQQHPDVRRARLAFVLRHVFAVQTQKAPFFDVVGRRDARLVKVFVMADGVGIFFLADELFNHRFPQADIQGRSLQCLDVPLTSVLKPTLVRERSPEAGHGVQVVRMHPEPGFVVLRKARVVAAFDKHAFDPLEDVAIQPAVRIQLIQQ